MFSLPFPNVDRDPESDSFKPMYDGLIAVGHNILQSIKSSIAEQLIGPGTYFASIPEWQLRLAAFVLVAMGLMGHVLARVNKPGARKVPPVLRKVGWCLQWSAFIVGIFAIAAMTIFSLSFVLAGGNEMLLAPLKHQAYVAGQGAFIGSFALQEQGQATKVEKDERCFARTGAKCSNDHEKRALAEKVIDTLVSGGLVNEAERAKAVDRILSDSRVKDLIEFSRAVHAEMHAILGASRLAGDKIVGGKIFVTTYPCHSCARHIVAAGISEVHYIEPYRKSLATRLHDDSLTEDVNSLTMVRLLQFDGIAPRRFIDLFEAGNRKKAGVLHLSGKFEAVPSTHVSLRAIPRLEDVVVAEILSKHLQLPVLVSKGK